MGFSTLIRNLHVWPKLKSKLFTFLSTLGLVSSKIGNWMSPICTIAATKMNYWTRAMQKRNKTQTDNCILHFCRFMSNISIYQRSRECHCVFLRERQATTLFIGAEFLFFCKKVYPCWLWLFTNVLYACYILYLDIHQNTSSIVISFRLEDTREWRGQAC